jgi:hypothetical protein
LVKHREVGKDRFHAWLDAGEVDVLAVSTWCIQHLTRQTHNGTGYGHMEGRVKLYILVQGQATGKVDLVLPHFVQFHQEAVLGAAHG